MKVHELSEEEIAIKRYEEKQALVILKRLRFFASLSKKHNTGYASQKLRFWERKADLLIGNVDEVDLTPTYNFKSLMEQKREGSL
jgi:hypothetical protein